MVVLLSICLYRIDSVRRGKSPLSVELEASSWKRSRGSQNLPDECNKV
jgi:hypothetical protein